jgi:type IV pilus assembly protein PilW
MDSRFRNRKLLRHQGFTLLELMIAMTIGLFLLGALLIIVQTNRAVFGNQNKMSQLQDAERMVLTMMSDVIQSAGYFPDPTTTTQTSALAAVAPFGAGESISGTYSAADPGDQISVRYMTAGGDGILNCSGTSNPVGNLAQRYVNVFYVQNGQLVCNMNTAPFNLVGDDTNIVITHLSVLYGVKSNTSLTTNDVDTYMTAQDVAANLLWSNVITATIKVTFKNPLYTPNQTLQPQTVSVQRTVAIMNQTGPLR